MSSDSDSLSVAVQSAKEQAVRSLAGESAEALGFDADRMATMEAYLRDAWLFGVRTGHAVMVETKLGQEDPMPVIRGAQGEFQDLMEDLADALDTTVGATIAAWHYLGQAWIAGARFWEVEIAARVIERRAGGFEEALRRLGEERGS